MSRPRWTRQVMCRGTGKGWAGIREHTLQKQRLTRALTAMWRPLLHHLDERGGAQNNEREAAIAGQTQVNRRVDASVPQGPTQSREVCQRRRLPPTRPSSSLLPESARLEPRAQRCCSWHCPRPLSVAPARGGRLGAQSRARHSRQRRRRCPARPRRRWKP